ncbi:Uncharacterized protein PBTT_07536 [Plasmodiophora brassicae]
MGEASTVGADPPASTVSGETVRRLERLSHSDNVDRDYLAKLPPIFSELETTHSNVNDFLHTLDKKPKAAAAGVGPGQAPTLSPVKPPSRKALRFRSKKSSAPQRRERRKSGGQPRRVDAVGEKSPSPTVEDAPKKVRRKSTRFGENQVKVFDADDPGKDDEVGEGKRVSEDIMDALEAVNHDVALKLETLQEAFSDMPNGNPGERSGSLGDADSLAITDEQSTTNFSARLSTFLESYFDNEFGNESHTMMMASTMTRRQTLEALQAKRAHFFTVIRALIARVTGTIAFLDEEYNTIASGSGSLKEFDFIELRNSIMATVSALTRSATTSADLRTDMSGLLERSRTLQRNEERRLSLMEMSAVDEENRFLVGRQDMMEYLSHRQYINKKALARHMKTLRQAKTNERRANVFITAVASDEAAVDANSADPAQTILRMQIADAVQQDLIAQLRARIRELEPSSDTSPHHEGTPRVGTDAEERGRQVLLQFRHLEQQVASQQAELDRERDMRDALEMTIRNLKSAIRREALARDAAVADPVDDEEEEESTPTTESGPDQKASTPETGALRAKVTQLRGDLKRVVAEIRAERKLRARAEQESAELRIKLAQLPKAVHKHENGGSDRHNSSDRHRRGSVTRAGADVPQSSVAGQQPPSTTPQYEAQPVVRFIAPKVPQSGATSDSQATVDDTPSQNGYGSDSGSEDADLNEDDDEDDTIGGVSNRGAPQPHVLPLLPMPSSNHGSGPVLTLSPLSTPHDPLSNVTTPLMSPVPKATPKPATSESGMQTDGPSSIWSSMTRDVETQTTFLQKEVVVVHHHEVVPDEEKVASVKKSNGAAATVQPTPSTLSETKILKSLEALQIAHKELKASHDGLIAAHKELKAYRDDLLNRHFQVIVLLAMMKWRKRGTPPAVKPIAPSVTPPETTVSFVGDVRPEIKQGIQNVQRQRLSNDGTQSVFPASPSLSEVDEASLRTTGEHQALPEESRYDDEEDHSDISAGSDDDDEAGGDSLSARRPPQAGNVKATLPTLPTASAPVVPAMTSTSPLISQPSRVALGGVAPSPDVHRESPLPSTTGPVGLEQHGSSLDLASASVVPGEPVVESGPESTSVHKRVPSRRRLAHGIPRNVDHASEEGNVKEPASDDEDVEALLNDMDKFDLETIGIGHGRDDPLDDYYDRDVEHGSVLEAEDDYASRNGVEPDGSNEIKDDTPYDHDNATPSSIAAWRHRRTLVRQRSMTHVNAKAPPPASAKELDIVSKKLASTERETRDAWKKVSELETKCGTLEAQCADLQTQLKQERSPTVIVDLRADNVKLRKERTQLLRENQELSDQIAESMESDGDRVAKLMTDAKGAARSIADLELRRRIAKLEKMLVWWRNRWDAMKRAREDGTDISAVDDVAGDAPDPTRAPAEPASSASARKPPRSSAVSSKTIELGNFASPFAPQRAPVPVLPAPKKMAASPPAARKMASLVDTVLQAQRGKGASSSPLSPFPISGGAGSQILLPSPVPAPPASGAPKLRAFLRRVTTNLLKPDSPSPDPSPAQAKPADLSPRSSKRLSFSGNSIATASDARRSSTTSSTSGAANGTLRAALLAASASMRRSSPASGKRASASSSQQPPPSL